MNEGSEVWENSMCFRENITPNRADVTVESAG